MSSRPFNQIDVRRRAREQIKDGAYVLRDRGLASKTELLIAIDAASSLGPFRHMVTRGGYTMSVSIMNCGAWGWVADRRGYEYTTDDPATGSPWPAMPDVFARLPARLRPLRFIADDTLPSV
jgi:alkylated DNA repair protein (DNA oxidative demethylase)